MDEKDVAERPVPIREWIPEWPFDHAEYLSRAAVSIDDLPPADPPEPRAD